VAAEFSSVTVCAAVAVKVSAVLAAACVASLTAVWTGSETGAAGCGSDPVEVTLVDANGTSFVPGGAVSVADPVVPAAD
jgi:hypothetical protein